MANIPQNADFGLLGYPLGHSFSKNFFTQLFACDGSGRVYDNFELPELTAEALYTVLLLNPSLRGFNVTAPYKLKIMEFLDSTDPTATEIGAVNTVRVVRDDNGRVRRLEGFNTDVEGFIAAIKPLLTDTDSGALVLGSGGASQAAIYALQQLGLKTLRVSRTSGEGKITYTDITAGLIRQYPVVVNATPVGTYPHTEACPPFPTELLGPSNLCFDMIYNPERTLLLQRASARGARVENGLQMLFNQAMASLRIWDDA